MVRAAVGREGGLPGLGGGHRRQHEVRHPREDRRQLRLEAEQHVAAHVQRRDAAVVEHFGVFSVPRSLNSAAAGAGRLDPLRAELH